MNNLLVSIRNGQYDMLIGLVTAAILMGCIFFLLLALSRRTKRNKKAAFESLDKAMLASQAASSAPKDPATAVPDTAKVPWEQMSQSIRQQILSVRGQRDALSENTLATKMAQEKIALRRLEIEGKKLDEELGALQQTKQKIELRKLEIELQTLDNELAALKEPNRQAGTHAPSGESSAPAPFRHRRSLGQQSPIENDFDNERDWPDYQAN